MESDDFSDLSTHDLVGLALADHDDQDTKDGVPTDDVVDWVVSRTELVRADVHDAIEWLHNRGHIYEPRKDHLRRTETDSERWLAVAWHEALVEARVDVADLDPRYLSDRYSAETRDEVDELVLQGVKEVIRGVNQMLTLDDLDKAEEKLEESGYEVMTDGGMSSSGTGRTRGGKDPRASHWFDFNQINDLPNDWTFEVLEWDDDPDADGVDDRGEAEVVRGDHRFVITTWLQPRARTHDRYWSVAYETINQDDEPELLSFHISTSQSIARNNLGHARDILDSGDTEPHVLVRNHSDGPRETFEYPTEHMAEKAADLQIELKLDSDDRDYLVTVHPKDEWQRTLERERSLQTDTDPNGGESA